MTLAIEGMQRLTNEDVGRYGAEKGALARAAQWLGLYKEGDVLGPDIRKQFVAVTRYMEDQAMKQIGQTQKNYIDQTTGLIGSDRKKVSPMFQHNIIPTEELAPVQQDRTQYPQAGETPKQTQMTQQSAQAGRVAADPYAGLHQELLKTREAAIGGIRKMLDSGMTPVEITNRTMKEVNNKVKAGEMDSAAAKIIRDELLIRIKAAGSKKK
jgi:hypothetical protein